ncbi:MAG: hypothetical protein IJZ39_05580 [Oscillospiraceae bacterium]|nr:hypothetical protein [Oscillospiraceae bacterium]
MAYISQADDGKINQIINAVTARYKQVYPDWEVAFLALPLHDREARRRILEFALKCEAKLA